MTDVADHRSMQSRRVPVMGAALAIVAGCVNLVAGAAAVALVAGATPAAHAQAGERVRLQASGATFPQPLYEKMVVEYERVAPGVQISYQGGGSGAGVRAITDKVVAFAASDAPLTKKQIEALGGENAVVEIPIVAGGVVPAYNLPGITTPVRFTGEILADIYLGRISRWNDARLKEINPGVELPDVAITPVYRSDGSGTTFVFTNYLVSQSKDFSAGVGRGTQVTWPLGLGAKGNPGVAAAIQKTEGSLGYVEMNFAQANAIPFGMVRNAAGEFVGASPESVALAGAAAADALSGSRLVANIWNQPGAGVYPIAAFTYIILYKDLSNLQSQSEADALMGFLWWATHDAQSIARDMHYAPLSEAVRARVGDALRSVTFKGAPVALPASVPSAPVPPAPAAPPVPPAPDAPGAAPSPADMPAKPELIHPAPR